MYSKEDGKKAILFYCGHPAHFHLVKNTAKTLQDAGNRIGFAIKSKDVLEDLLENSGFNYYKISGIETSIRLVKYIDAFLRLFKYALYIKRFKAGLLVGTSWENARLGKILNIYSMCLNEDDAEVVPLFANNAYPNSTEILLPECCSAGKYKEKSTNYNSYHELAYLHLNHFKANPKVVEKYFSPYEDYTILRFAKLGAHHDVGINGINDDLATQIIERISKFMRVYITSERPLIGALEQYRLPINPIDIHHVMAFASIYIGDSQTMAAESGVLGVPFIRFNDFVGRIGYLEELENKYQLGYGIKTKDSDKLMKKIDELLSMPDRKAIFQKRREIMLNEKIDYSKFLVWFIENYPESAKIMKENPDYQYKFR